LRARALASAHGHAWCVPGSIEVIGKTGEVRRRGGRFRHLHCLQSCFASLHSAKRGFPTLLELRSDQAIVGIAGGVAPLGEWSLIPRLLQIQLHDALLFTSAFHVHSLGFQSGFDRHRFNGAEKLSDNRSFDTRTAERQASARPHHLTGKVTTINGLSWWAPAIGHPQASPTTSTANYSSQQRASAASRLRTSNLGIIVGTELLLIPFKLCPIDIAFVVILQQNLALSK